MIDQFSKWVECAIIHDKTKETVAITLFNEWIARYGVPNLLVSDNDKTLCSEALEILYMQYGIRHIRASPYHPQGNATIESFHRTLNRGLTAFRPNRYQMLLSEALPLILYAYRMTLPLTTNEAPSYVVFGMDLRAPHENDWRFKSTKEEDRIKFLNHLRLDVQYQAFQRRLQDVQRKNNNREDVHYEEGELVLIRASQYDQLRHAHQTGDHAHKLIPKWSLPFRIVTLYAQRKVAYVRSLLTLEGRKVSLANVRKIQRPQLDTQYQEWSSEIETSLLFMFNENQRREILARFWRRSDPEHPIAGESSAITPVSVPVQQKRNREGPYGIHNPSPQKQVRYATRTPLVLPRSKNQIILEAELSQPTENPIFFE